MMRLTSCGEKGSPWGRPERFTKANGHAVAVSRERKAHKSLVSCDMDVLRGHCALGTPVRGWQAELTRLLDEHHLAAWSDSLGERASFAAGLGAFLAGIEDAQVLPIYGTHAADLEGLSYQIERSIPGTGPMRRKIDGPAGLVSRLRNQNVIPGRAPFRYRFLVWHDPDEMIERDPDLFGQVADAIAGVAAESEYASDDMLLITRAIYVGGPTLKAYAEREQGQLQSWLTDWSGEPFWRAVSGVDHPPVLASSVAALLEDPEGVAQEALMASIDALAL